MLCGSIYMQLRRGQDATIWWQLFAEKWAWQNVCYGFAALLLMPVNWGLEAAKWQKLAILLVPLSFADAFKGVLVGTAMALFTPNRVGEYGGRIYLLPSAAISWQAAALLLAGNICQLIINLSVGLLGFLIFWHFHGFLDHKVLFLLTTSTLLTVLALQFAYHFRASLAVFGARFPKMQRYCQPLLIWQHINTSLWLQLLGVSLLRYGVYVLQCYYLLCFTNIAVAPALVLFSAIVAMFFVQTIAPSIAIFELPIKGNIALFFFSYVTDKSHSIALVVLLLWGINLALPALVGGAILTQERQKDSSHK